VALAVVIAALVLYGSRVGTLANVADYEAAYRWPSGDLLHVQRWPEIDPAGDLVAFDADGTLRTLYASGPDRFVAGPGAGLRDPVESRLTFQRDQSGQVVSVTWR